MIIKHILLVTALACGCEAALAAEDEVELLRSHSNATYVHRITLYDHDGETIDPEDDFAGPYSPRMTCSKCHPYDQIGHGWHFSAPDADVPAGRPGEPWMLVDENAGIVLPLSGRGWSGSFKPQVVGLSNWDFVMKFGHHLPGGSFGEPPDEVVDESEMSLRWGISGKLEIDCLFCHATDTRHDPAEAERQIEKENFKWLPTAAFGLAVIRGEAAKAPDDFDPLMPPDPDFPEKAGPQMIWDLNRFDPDGRVLFNLSRRPPTDRCYFCHSFREVGDSATDDLIAPRDIHLASGMNCVDCHLNELDHQIVRGYRDEASQRGDEAVAAYSCEGCHVGVSGAGDPAVALGGYYGAPHPEHKGLPPLHFDKLSCTTCHAGPWPEMDAKRFQTALAHGLGLATFDRHDTAEPRIVGPIFGRQDDGKIAPQRLVWPAYWARLTDGELTPIPPAEVEQAAATLLSQREADESEPKPPLTDEQIKTVLEALAANLPESSGQVCYLRDGLIHTANGKTEAVASDEAYYRWSIGHDVRPASQSLGVNGCTDCHSSGTPIYFGRITDTDDAQVDTKPIKLMHELRGDDPIFAGVWNFGFTFRPFFKFFGFTCAGLIVFIVLHYGLNGIGSLTRRIGR